MQEHHREGSEHRNGEHGLRHGDAEQHDERHPDQIEHGDDDAEALGAKPGEPAEQELGTLLRGDMASSRDEGAPMLLDELHPAIGPAMTLPLIGGEV